MHLSLQHTARENMDTLVAYECFCVPLICHHLFSNFSGVLSIIDLVICLFQLSNLLVVLPRSHNLYRNLLGFKFVNELLGNRLIFKYKLGSYIQLFPGFLLLYIIYGLIVFGTSFPILLCYLRRNPVELFFSEVFSRLSRK